MNPYQLDNTAPWMTLPATAGNKRQPWNAAGGITGIGKLGAGGIISRAKNSRKNKLCTNQNALAFSQSVWKVWSSHNFSISPIDISLSVKTSKTNMVIVLSATFNTNAIDSFFTGADQLSLSIYTRNQMVVEGISSHVDLPEFNKDGVSSIVRAFERPPQVPNGAGDLVNQTPFQFPAKSQKRFVIAIEISDYYNQTNQEVSLTMMMWQTLKSYSIQMSALSGTSNPQTLCQSSHPCRCKNS